MPENKYNELNIKTLNKKSRELDILKQELDLNIELQRIVEKRIKLLKETSLEIPNTQPEYAILSSQLEMDKIELDELKYREEQIKSLIQKYS